VTFIFSSYFQNCAARSRIAAE